MKITLKRLLAHAKAAGYAGDEGDVEAIKSFVEANVSLYDANGAEIAVKSLEIVPEETKAKKSIRLGIEDQPAQGAPSLGATGIAGVRQDDLDAIVQGAVTKALATHKIRPSAQDIPVSVRTAEEALYESEMALGKTAFKSFEKATLWRDHFLANIIGNTCSHRAYSDHENVHAARKRLSANAATKQYATSPNAAGGALLATEFYPDLIRNVSEYGVSRRLARVIPMSEQTTILPVMTGRHTLSYPTEGAAITASTGVSYRNVQLNARDGSTIVKVSRRLVQDSSLNFMDEAFREIARAIAYTEDYCLFSANGEAAYGGMIGLVSRFTNGSPLTITTAAGRVAGGGNWGAHAMSNLAELFGKIPDYARPNAVFTCTPEATQILHRIGMAQGGVTYAETVNNGYVMKFYGRPVIENNMMNSSSDTGTTTIDIMYGDFSRAALIGDRMGVEIDVSDQRYWDENNIGVRGIIRHHVNVHDVGDATNRGPVAYLYQT